MSYLAQCPNCGSPARFEFDDSVVLVCRSCRSLLVRNGADIENAGEIAELVSTDSLLALGEMGSYDGQSFQISGRIQVKHAAGVWDEWRLTFADGGHGWFAESLGRRHILVDRSVEGIPALDSLKVGSSISALSMRVTELGAATAVTLEGELPQDVRPGQTWRYADLAGLNGSFGTIDFGEGTNAQAVFVGREVTLKDAGLGHLAGNAAAKPAAARSLKCPQCGGALSLRAPDQSMTIACPYCGTLSSVEGDLKAVHVPKKKAAALTFKPRFPLGAKARLQDSAWIVVGAMERSAMEIYTWREYLLHDANRGFGWLIEDRGHWAWVKDAHAGDVGSSSGGAAYEGRSYRHFSSASARVESLVGEFPWAVRRGETSQTVDYIAPPYLLSEDRTDKEITYSAGRYLERAEVEQAFGLSQGTLPPPVGVHPAQPNPHAARANRALGAAVIFAIFLFGLYTLGRARTKVVFEDVVAIPQGAAQGSPEATFISRPFEITGSGNVEVRVTAALSNQWLYLDGTLAREGGSSYGDFDVEASAYSGVEDGTAWSEGSGTGVTYVGRVPPGIYTLRTAAQWGGTAPVPPPVTSYGIKVTRSVARVSHLLVALGLLAAWPIVLALRRAAFETARWAESDHAGE